MRGALNGAMIPTTPTGLRRVDDNRGCVDGRTWPSGTLASAAAWRNSSAAPNAPAK
jgi:hypothetical protein